ncbi:MAG: hypothetical protein ACREB3_17330, partial [Burkholderiales bacterium]
GYDISGDELAACYGKVMALADSKKQITDRDLLATVHQVMRQRVRTAPRTQPEPATSAAD